MTSIAPSASMSPTVTPTTLPGAARPSRRTNAPACRLVKTCSAPDASTNTASGSASRSRSAQAKRRTPETPANGCCSLHVPLPLFLRTRGGPSLGASDEIDIAVHLDVCRPAFRPRRRRRPGADAARRERTVLVLEQQANHRSGRHHHVCTEVVVPIERRDVVARGSRVPMADLRPVATSGAPSTNRSAAAIRADDGRRRRPSSTETPATVVEVLTTGESLPS